jgi:hypothetical protein
MGDVKNSLIDEIAVEKRSVGWIGVISLQAPHLIFRSFRTRSGQRTDAALFGHLELEG